MTDSLHVDFEGPFGWFDDADVPALGQVSVGRRAGVYLWTVPIGNGELVYYVGQTGRSFCLRMTKHLSQQLSGMYHIYEPNAFASGVKRVLWKGMYESTREKGLGEFVNRLPTLVTSLVGFVRLMCFRVAPLDCDARVRTRIEAALSRHLRDQPEPVGPFQDNGIRYVHRRSDEEPILITCSPIEGILGLPATIEV